MSELVTGDAVVLGLRPAKLPSRALALCLDLAVVWTAFILLTVGVLAGISSLDGAALAAVMVALAVLVPVGVPVAVETLTRGRSLGKLACGLRVVREDGGPIRFRHALVRGLMTIVEIQLCLGVIACFASLVSPRGRRLGDVFAGTLVVRERIPSGGADGRIPQAPPHLAGLMRTVDLSRVPDGLWLAVRQYQLRARQLDPQIAASMAARLADDVAVRSGRPVPEGMAAEDYLAAVVAARRERDGGRRLTPHPPAGPLPPRPVAQDVRPATVADEPPPSRGGFAPPA